MMKKFGVREFTVGAFVLALLAGCASPADRTAMVAQDFQVAKRYEKTVEVKTAGGSETGAMDSSNITNDDFKAAIEESITQSKMFRSIVQGKDSDYELAVNIVQVDKPAFGMSFTVNMEATWVLVKKSDQSIAMKKLIKSSHTATFGDAAAGVKRLRLALEGSARKNIEQGLRAVAELKL